MHRTCWGFSFALKYGQTDGIWEDKCIIIHM
jgi:hypothetical protein